MRLLLVVALLAVFAVAKVWYDRRSASLSDRSSLDLPNLPDRLRGPGRTWVVFATEFCATCGPVADRLRALHPDDTVHKVLVEDDPALADSYAVRTAPTLLEVAPSGAVVHSVAGAEPVLRHVGALAV
ncbi:thioredoxin family protein [Actinospongicola halichondriae]|uniref:thioredoxin family protein n=1 Tax=Actinospongicola halichondriae TaxID=3236844 RepID=UPI003D426529